MTIPNANDISRRGAEAVHSLPAAHFLAVRAETERIAAPISAEDAGLQSMSDASPTKWHLAHTSWFFETFVLERHEKGFAAFDPAFRVLFNSYYNGIGEKHPRHERGLISRPDLAHVMAYRRDVTRRVAALLQTDSSAEPARLIALGCQHEQQHQELILTDIKHLLSKNPTLPAYRPGRPPVATADASTAMHWRAFAGGLVEIGHHGPGFAFDNESPRHKVWLDPFELATRPVNHADFAAFVDAGGYRDPRWWLSLGWDWIAQHRIEMPMYWLRIGDDWHSFTLHGPMPLDPRAPICHLNYFEADAYARWAGARLPSEAEWEHAAAALPVEGNLPATDRLHPQASDESDDDALSQMFGEVWQWTRSSYAPYPGYRPPAGAIGEYNGKFMCNQYVLRGGSCITPRGHARATYRNFFPPDARWQFSGLRLARDGTGGRAGPEKPPRQI